MGMPMDRAVIDGTNAYLAAVDKPSGGWVAKLFQAVDGLRHEVRQARVEMQQTNERLDRIEKQMSLNVTKEAYTVEDIAEKCGKRPWTVRNWCNKDCIQAYKN